MKRNSVRKNLCKEDLQKKRDAERKAVAIVERLLENDVSEDYLLDCVKQITVEHFNDVIQERSIMKLCGYPLCRKKLKTVIRQTYTINTKLNKVYDITERKNFCSNQCYAAAKFLREQIASSPLWIRDLQETPDVKLLRSDSLENSFGEEVDIGDSGGLKQELADERIKEKETKVQLETNTKTGPVLDGKNLDSHQYTEKSDKKKNSNMLYIDKNSFQSVSLKEVNENCDTISKSEMKIIKVESGPHGILKEKNHECEGNKDFNVSFIGNNEITNSESSECKNIKKYSKRTVCRSKSLQNDVIDCKNSSKNPQSVAHTNLVYKIETSVHEWFTSDTAELLFGDSPVHKDITELHSYSRLCKLIEVLDMDDEQDLPQNPMPDYSELQKRSVDLEVKTKAFYSGSVVYPVIDIVNKEEPTTFLPLVDIHAQRALRRRILLDRLNRVLTDLQEALRLTSLNITSEVRQLVGTFKLSAHNITFTPEQWNFLGLVIINLLSVKNRRLKRLLHSPEVRKYQAMILFSFQQDPNYMDRLIVWLSELDFSNNEVKI